MGTHRNLQRIMGTTDTLKMPVFRDIMDERAQVVELAYTCDSKSHGLTTLWVQVPPWAPVPLYIVIFKEETVGSRNAVSHRPSKDPSPGNRRAPTGARTTPLHPEAAAPPMAQTERPAHGTPGVPFLQVLNSRESTSPPPTSRRGWLFSESCTHFPSFLFSLCDIMHASCQMCAIPEG